MSEDSPPAGQPASDSPTSAGEAAGGTALERFNAISNAREAYRDLSGTASKLARGLAGGGLGLVLVLGGATKDFEAGKIVDLSDGLIVAGIVLIAALFCDIAQYVYSAAAFATWGRLAEKKWQEARKIDESTLPPEDYPTWINRPTLVLFWGKLLLVLVGYAILLYYMAFQVS